MYRNNTNTKLDEDNFSVGSIINDDRPKLVIGFVRNGEQMIKLLDLRTFQVDDMENIPVQDMNFLSQEEASNLVNHTQSTRSDFDWQPVGLKQLKYKNGVIDMGNKQ